MKTTGLRQVVLLLVGFLILGLYLAFFVELDTTLEALLHSNVLFVVLAVVVWLIAIAVDTSIWALALRKNDSRPTSFLGLFQLHLSTLMAGVYLPTGGVLLEMGLKVRLGSSEIQRQLVDREGSVQPITDGLIASVAYVRYVAGFGMIAVFVLMAFLIPQETGLGWDTSLFLGVPLAIFTFTGSVLILFLSTRPGVLLLAGEMAVKVSKMLGLERTSHYFSSRYPQLVLEYQETFSQLVSAKLLFVGCLLLFWFKKALDTIAIYLLFNAVVPVPIAYILLVDFISGSLNLIPLPIPGMEGIKQVALAETLAQIGISERALSVAGAIVANTYVYVGGVFALIYFFVLRPDYGKVAEQVLEEQRGEELASTE